MDHNYDFCHNRALPLKSKVGYEVDLKKITAQNKRLFLAKKVNQTTEGMR